MTRCSCRRCRNRRRRPSSPGFSPRVAFRRREYVVVVGNALEPLDEELELLREILGYVVPIALGLAGFGGWFLARQSLSPVVAMADRARRIASRT